MDIWCCLRCEILHWLYWLHSLYVREASWPSSAAGQKAYDKNLLCALKSLKTVGGSGAFIVKTISICHFLVARGKAPEHILYKFCTNNFNLALKLTHEKLTI